jgi:hypothetical protein
MSKKKIYFLIKVPIDQNAQNKTKNHQKNKRVPLMLQKHKKEALYSQEDWLVVTVA